MNYTKILFAVILICSCKSKSTSKQIIQKEEKVVCVPYFEFDKIEHYYIKIEELNIWKIYEKKGKTVDEKMFIELILGDTLDKISDTVILKDIQKCGYKMQLVSDKKFESINNIFCERKHANAMYSACATFYRDILVFKKRDKIIGTAKICFECGANVIVGTKLNTYEFGQSGDYSKLRKLLYN